MSVHILLTQSKVRAAVIENTNARRHARTGTEAEEIQEDTREAEVVMPLRKVCGEDLGLSWRQA